MCEWYSCYLCWGVLFIFFMFWFNIRHNKKSVYEHLAKKGIINAFVDQKLEAGLSSGMVSKKLDIKDGHPVLIMSLIVYMKNGIAYNCGNEFYRTDKFTLVQSVYNM